MGHRHMYNAPQVFDPDSDQGWSYAEQPYMPMATTSASEGSSQIHPVDNIAIQGGHFASQWPAPPFPSGYSSSNFNNELPRYQPLAPGPSSDPFLHQSAGGNFHIHQDNYSHHPSSSNVGGQALSGTDNGFYDQTMGGGRGPYKRKSPGVPTHCDRASTSRYRDVGSSSDIILPADPWQEKQTTETYPTPWEYTPSYRANSLSIGGEGVLRNVRSRAAVDLEANLARTHLSTNSLHHSFSSRSSEQSNSGDFWGQNPNVPSREWNRYLISSTAQPGTFGPDSSFFSHEPNAGNSVNNQSNGSLEIGVYNPEVTSSRNPVHQNVNSNLIHPVRGIRSGYGQRSIPTLRASSSTFRPGHVAASDGGPQLTAENYPSRHPRAFSTLRLQNIDRNTRVLIPSDRYRSFTDDGSFRNRFTPEGLVVAEHSAFYGSRAMFDQHRDMRLDIDNMSYEELLALGERIGSVSTGLSDNLISKCLTESIYCSSDLSQDEAACVICLEEYCNMDDVGTLKACGHDFHVGCIRKWLSMKNSCPICKAAALDDNMKEK